MGDKTKILKIKILKYLKSHIESFDVLIQDREQKKEMHTRHIRSSENVSVRSDK